MASIREIIVMIVRVEKAETAVFKLDTVKKSHFGKFEDEAKLKIEFFFRKFLSRNSYI